MILSALLLTLDKYSSWRVGRVVPMIRPAVRTTLRSLLLVAELIQTSIDMQRTDSVMRSRTVSAAPVAAPQLVKEVQPLLDLFNNGLNVNVPLQVLRDGAAQEPERLYCSHSAVHDGGEWGVSPEVHDQLHCFERVQLQVVKTAPDSQLLKVGYVLLHTR